MKKINIAIVGLGTIGSYFYNFISKNKDAISKKTNVIPNIIYVCARNPKKKDYLKFQKRNG